MESKRLDSISGAWVDRGQTKFMKVAIKAEYDLSLVTSRTEKTVIQGLRTGVLGSTGGMAASVFTVISNTFGLKSVCGSETGRTFYTNFQHDDFREGVVAIIALQTKTPDAGRYVNTWSNGIHSYSWPGGLVILRQVYADTVGLDDKELREKAIDFLAAGGKFTQTWIDRYPR